LGDKRVSGFLPFCGRYSLMSSEILLVRKSATAGL
jgi:hypothetical protein